MKQKTLFIINPVSGTGRQKNIETVIRERPAGDDPLAAARYMHDTVLPAMEDLRQSADTLETLTDRSYWPFPTYDELLFSI